MSGLPGGGGGDISIHVLRKEDDHMDRQRRQQQPRISIHVLREEDDAHLSWVTAGEGISIHVLREEDDICW